MTDSTRVRLERAFATLQKQRITPILILAGSPGIGEQIDKEYRRLAAEAGTPADWVGAHVGAEEHGGGYWDAAGELYYRYDDSPVVTIWWWYPNLGCARALRDALVAEDLECDWSGDGFTSVELTLTAVPA